MWFLRSGVLGELAYQGHEWSPHPARPGRKKRRLRSPRPPRGRGHDFNRFSPRILEGEGPVADLSSKSWESKKQHEVWVGYARMKNVYYISRRPSMAFSMVTSSANSSSDPTGIPMAMRLTVTPRGLMSLEM
jgi:hypothetical protein